MPRKRPDWEAANKRDQMRTSGRVSAHADMEPVDPPKRPREPHEVAMDAESRVQDAINAYRDLPSSERGVRFKAFEALVGRVYREASDELARGDRALASPRRSRDAQKMLGRNRITAIADLKLL